MAQTIKHAKVSGVPDGADTNQIQPSNWNADHVITGSVAYSEVTGKPATFPPTVPIAQSDVTNLIGDLALKAPLASPTFTGNPTAPTPATADNDTSIATTAHVQANAALKANVSHTHAQADVTNLVGDLALKAPLVSPALTGVPTVPTAAPATNTTQAASTAFVTAAVAAVPGTSLASTIEVLTGTNSAKAVTPDALAALWERGTDVVAAATVNLGEGGYFTVSGNTGITGITFATATAGRRAILIFTGSPLLTHSSTFSLPANINRQVTPGDMLEVVFDGTNYRVVSYLPEDGKPLTSTGGFKNVLINPCGTVNHRNTGSAIWSDDFYGFDRWNILSQSGTVGMDQGGTLFPVNGMKSMRLYNNVATLQRFGACQIIEGKHCRQLRGKTVTLSGNCMQNYGSNRPVYAAILEWTGTEDVVTSDVVNNWVSTDFVTPGQFFIATVTPKGTSSTTVPGTSAPTELTPLTVTLGSSFNNLIVFYWMGDVVGQNIVLDMQLQLEEGPAATPFEFRPLQIEQNLCQRYSEQAQCVIGTSGVSNPATNQMAWRTPKRTSPTFTLSFDAGTGATFNPANPGLHSFHQVTGHTQIATATIYGTCEL